MQRRRRRCRRPLTSLSGSIGRHAASVLAATRRHCCHALLTTTPPLPHCRRRARSPSEPRWLRPAVRVLGCWHCCCESDRWEGKRRRGESGAPRMDGSVYSALGRTATTHTATNQTAGTSHSGHTNTSARGGRPTPVPATGQDHAPKHPQRRRTVDCTTETICLYKRMSPFVI